MTVYVCPEKDIDCTRVADEWRCATCPKAASLAPSAEALPPLPERPSADAGAAGVPQGWISVEERMPAEQGVYLVWLNDNESGWTVDRAWLADFWSWSGSWDGCPPLEDGHEVTHWMPLPTAPALQKQPEDQAQAADSEGGEVA